MSHHSMDKMWHLNAQLDLYHISAVSVYEVIATIDKQTGCTELQQGEISQTL